MKNYQKQQIDSLKDVIGRELSHSPDMPKFTDTSLNSIAEEAIFNDRVEEIRAQYDSDYLSGLCKSVGDMLVSLSQRFKYKMNELQETQHYEKV